MNRILFVLTIVIFVAGCDSGSSGNHPPEVQEISLDDPSVTTSQFVWISAIATDEDGDSIQYKWSASGGKVLTGGGTDVPDYSPTTNPTRWRAPENPGTYTITCTVSDGVETSSSSISVDVN